MPIYEYRCSQCDTAFEELHLSAPGKTIACPKCGSANTKKMMSAAGISTGASRDPACASTCASANPSCCGGGACPMH